MARGEQSLINESNKLRHQLTISLWIHWPTPTCTQQSNKSTHFLLFEKQVKRTKTGIFSQILNEQELVLQSPCLQILWKKSGQSEWIWGSVRKKLGINVSLWQNILWGSRKCVRESLPSVCLLSSWWLKCFPDWGFLDFSLEKQLKNLEVPKIDFFFNCPPKVYALHC